MLSLKTVFVLACVYFLPMVLADAAFNATVLSEPPKYIDSTITLDDLNITKSSVFVPPAGIFMNITVEGRQQQIALRGVMCTISKSFTLTESKWDGSKAWPDSNNETFPGYFIASVFMAEGDNCTLHFKEPIAQFYARVNTDVITTEGSNPSNSIIQILDLNGDEISSANVPMMAGAINNYTALGFSSTRPIYSVVLTNAYNVIDDIQWTFFYCKDGFFRDVDGECKDINECETNPCSSSASCINTISSFNCTCNTGYFGDGMGASGCEDVNECLASNSTCGSNSYCNNTIGGYQCTCNEGFKGDPYESEGCKEHAETVSPPSVGAPIGRRLPILKSASVTSVWCFNLTLLFALCNLFVF